MKKLLIIKLLILQSIILSGQEKFTYFDFGLLSYKSKGESLSDFQGEGFNRTEPDNDGIVILPKFDPNYGFIVSAGLQNNKFRIFGISGGVSYTRLFPKATWENNEVEAKYHFIDFNTELLIFPIKQLSVDLTAGINLLTRLKIQDGSYMDDNSSSTILMEDVKLSGGIFKNFPANIQVGVGLSFYITPCIIISGDAFTRLIAFKYVTGAMGKNIQISPFDDFLSGIHDYSNYFQISMRFLLQKK
jgi:hypothetical protein